jgi:hypothetical protein
MLARCVQAGDVGGRLALPRRGVAAHRGRHALCQRKLTRQGSAAERST